MDWLAAYIPLSAAGWWAVAGLVLLCLELLAPGIFLMWFGGAALVVALATLVLAPPLSWQLVLFAMSALLAVYFGWRWYRRNGDAPQGALRDPSDLMVGSAGTVAEPLRHGHGKVRVNDSLWLAEGPDLDIGASVRVVGQRGTVLAVEPAP
jgi:membrane protein implicated in regulation of membrane protease activity